MVNFFMEIIKTTINHLEAVYELVCELESKNLNKNDFSQIYRDNINNDNIYYLVAVDESGIIGFASLHIQKLLHHCGKVGEIQEIIISKNQQGTGVGTALFNRIKETAVLNNCVLLEVCCNKIREKSHWFYIKQGMKKSHYKFVLNL